MTAQSKGDVELRDIELRLGAWAQETHRAAPSPELVATAMDRVESTRQRPSLLVRPLVSGDRMPRSSLLVPALAVLLAVILALATAIAAARLLLHDQSTPMGNGGIVVQVGKTAYLVASDGSRTALPIPLNDSSCPTYSPDGQHLAYISDPSHEGDGPTTLTVAAADGTDPMSLWTGTFADDFRQIVWSRDSSRVYVNGAMTRTGSGVGSLIGDVAAGTTNVIAQLGSDWQGAVSFNGADPTEIAFISMDGTHVEVIDTDTGFARTVATGGRIDSVSWSPDGTTIAYTAASAEGANDGHLYFVDTGGSNVRDVSAGAAGSEGLLAWSPDGTLVAVKVEGASPDGTFAMALFDRQGRAVRSLGPFALSGNFAFTWSPDSKDLLLGLGGGMGTGPNGPLIAPVDGGPTRSIGVAAGEYNLQCPLSWQPVSR